jgi:hypothetical protein
MRVVSVILLGYIAPVLLVFVVDWINEGAGRLSLAYPRPFWLDIWGCVGLWVAVVIALFHYALLQRDIAWMVLRTPATLWIFAMTGLFVASLVSIMTYELDRVIALPVYIPFYIFCSLFIPLVAMADAVPPRLRVLFHRIGGVGTMLILTTIGVVLRLPAALHTPGDSKWAVLGVEMSLACMCYNTVPLCWGC